MALGPRNRTVGAAAKSQVGSVQCVPFLKNLPGTVVMRTLTCLLAENMLPEYSKLTTQTKSKQNIGKALQHTQA